MRANEDRPGANVSTSREPNAFQKFGRHVQSKTMSGLMELVPLLVTLIVLWFIISYADQFVRPMGFVAGRPWDVPGIGIVSAIVIFYIVGVLVSTRIGRKVMGWQSAALNRVPVVKTVHSVTQQATSILTSQYGFTRVVFIEWPREGMVAMGFVTGRAYAEDTGQSMVAVYVPTVPNPTSGNMAFVIEDDVMETDLTVEDAMRLVFSGGIVLPEVLSMARVPRVPGERELIGRFETESNQGRREA